METQIIKKSSVKERLLSFIDCCGVSISEFERQCKLGKGTIPNMRRSLDPDKLLAIAEKFPALSMDWLMIGRGDMLRTGIITPTEQSNIEELREKVDLLKKNIDDLRETVSAKDDTIAALKALITELKRGTAPLTSVAAE